MLNPTLMRLAYAALASALLSGLVPACTVYWGDDGDDDVICPLAGASDEAIAVPAPGLRNPFNLQCEFFGGGGSGCGAVDGDLAPVPTWGQCGSACDGLDESACGFTAGCRTAYDHACLLTDGPCPALTPFLGCFPTDTTGPVQGACEGLDAFECSRHDNCLSTYSENNGVRAFQLCLPELTPECGDCG